VQWNRRPPGGEALPADTTGPPFTFVMRIVIIPRCMTISPRPNLRCRPRIRA
jgi:hypothetical protein